MNIFGIGLPEIIVILIPFQHILKIVIFLNLIVKELNMKYYKIYRYLILTKLKKL